MSKILVIDDDRSVRHLIDKAFEGSDVEVVSAATAEEGLRLLARSAARRGAARHPASEDLRPRIVRRAFATPTRSCR